MALHKQADDFYRVREKLRMTSAIPTTRRALLTAAAATSLLPKTSVAKARNGRERLSLNEGWRFHAGDPEGLNGALDYDVRPEIK